MPATLFLIRHGETAWSLLGRHTSRTDLTLTEQGERDAGRLASKLQSVGFSHVFTSPRLRARRTCELAGLGASAVVEPDLAEWEYGDYEGLLATEIQARRPGWSIYRDGCPGGESAEAIAARADRLIARLRALEGNVALFSHGHMGRVVAARWIALPVTGAANFSLSPASLSILGWNQTRPVIAQWNALP
jgi:probable phosphoglycerate mutase